MTAEELWGLYNDKRILILPCPIGAEVYRVIRQRNNYDDRCCFIASNSMFVLDDIPQLGNSVFLTREEAEDAARLLNRGGRI